MEQTGKRANRFNVADWLIERHVRESRGDRVAVAGVERAVTYAELADGASRFGSALRELGVQPGDRVLLVLPDSPEFIICFFGAVKVGAIAVPVNPFARSGDYAHYIADCGARLAVVHADSLGPVRAAFETVQSPPRILTTGVEGSGKDTLEGWLARFTNQCETHPTTGDDIAFFLYTSGSGGVPKAAMHRHCHMRVTVESFGAQVLGIRADDVTFSVSKLFFAYGLGNGLTFPFSVGATTVLLPDKPAPEKIFAVLRQYRPTLFFSVPTIYGALLRVAEGTDEQLESVRLAVSAGEALPAEIFERFRRRFGLEIIDGIGTTEMLHMFMSNRPGEARPGSCGSVVPGYEAHIVEENTDGEAGDVPVGEIGNLWVRGGSAFTGYWNKPELTARARRGEWVVTGDKFYLDTAGFYHYCGRTDDMLKVSGMWVSPVEVENALLAYDQVSEAAVVGRRNLEGLTEIVAHVVLRRAGQGGDALVDDLKAFVHERLPGYKCPQVFEFVPELPKTATGKIQRFKLRG